MQYIRKTVNVYQKYHTPLSLSHRSSSCDSVASPFTRVMRLDERSRIFNRTNFSRPCD